MKYFDNVSMCSIGWGRKNSLGEMICSTMKKKKDDAIGCPIHLRFVPFFFYKRLELCLLNFAPRQRCQTSH